MALTEIKKVLFDWSF